MPEKRNQSQRIELLFETVLLQWKEIDKLKDTIAKMDQWNAMDFDSGKLYKKGIGHGTKG